MLAQLPQAAGSFNALLDIVGILIGFVTIMLLMSLVVTALVQFAQSIFALRARNLQQGLESLLENLAPVPESAAATAPAPRDLVESVLRSARFVPRQEHKSLLRRIFRIAPPVTWIEKDELILRLADLDVTIDDGQRERFDQLFARMGDYLSKRFLLNIRIVTVPIALLVAFYFQVSAPELLRELSTNPAARAAYVAAAEGWLDGVPGDAAPTGEPAGGAAAAREPARALVGELARFDVTPWPEGWRYYGRFDHWIGIGITAILLTLGAPFWFESLKNLMKLKDALQPAPTKETAGDTADASA